MEDFIVFVDNDTKEKIKSLDKKGDILYTKNYTIRTTFKNVYFED